MVSVLFISLGQIQSQTARCKSRHVSSNPIAEWVAGVSRSVGYVMSWKSWPLLAWADSTLVKPWWDYMRLTSRIIGWTEPARAKANYLEHNATVRRVCPKERLLEFRPGKSGWNELCGFLGKDVPDTPFPKVPDEQFFVGVHIFYLIRVIKAAAKNVALATAAVSMIGAMAWYWGYLWPIKR